MKESEAIRLVAMLVDAFPRPPVETGTAKIYAEFIVDLGYEETLDAIKELALSEQWLPSIAQIRRLATSKTENHPGPDEAWQQVLGMVGSCGAYRTPKFKDPVVECAVAQVGWLYICNSKTDAEPFLRKEFHAAYQSALTRSVGRGGECLLQGDETRGLMGMHERENYRSPIGDIVTKKLKGES